MHGVEHTFADTNRHLVEVPDSFAVARWSRDADVATIARCILAPLKYEPHTADTTLLRQALEDLTKPEVRRDKPEVRGRTRHYGFAHRERHEGALPRQQKAKAG